MAKPVDPVVPSSSVLAGISVLDARLENINAEVRAMLLRVTALEIEAKALRAAMTGIVE
jgi:outer membrane murein-binding lipoprotein Lpp